MISCLACAAAASPGGRAARRRSTSASGVKSWTVHDHPEISVATRMGDIGVMPHIIETILNHQSGHKAGVAGDLP